jgi:hypothetical protein
MKKEITFRLTIVCVIFILAFKFGVDPMLNGNKKSDEWAKGKITREQGVFDVIVLGEEPEGIAAAVSAARAGAKTLLVSETDNLGGVLSKSLLSDLEPSFGGKGELLNKSYFQELYNRLGKNFTAEKYTNTVKSIIKKEKNIEVLYNADIGSPVLESNTLKGIVVQASGDRTQLMGKRFIDATREGKVLTACGVPYFAGAEDLNIKDCYLPIQLNFLVEGVSVSQISEVLKKPNFFQDIRKYETSDINIHLMGISILPQGKNRALVKGLEISGVNVENKAAIKKAYESGVREAEFLTAYLKKDFKEFEDMNFLKAADELYIKESVHFLGEYVLGVNDVMENKDFADKIAVGSYPVDGGKLARNSTYLIGKPDKYGIPMGCLVPLKIENLLMIGAKASYSSLAASSAGTLGVSIAEGQAAGVLAVYSIVENIKPRDIFQEKDKKIKELLAKQGFKMDEFNIKPQYEGEWSYPYIRQLIHLGLIAGGESNNFGTEYPATQRDFATLLLNGVYRLSPDKYGLEFDSHLRKFLNNDKLTVESASEILLTMYDKAFASGSGYNEALKYGYIDGVMKSRIKSDQTLKMEDVFYLSCLNIKKYTGKEILE